jgi:hypothetical protein
MPKVSVQAVVKARLMSFSVVCNFWGCLLVGLQVVFIYVGRKGGGAVCRVCGWRFLPCSFGRVLLFLVRCFILYTLCVLRALTLLIKLFDYLSKSNSRNIQRSRFFGK